MTHLRLNIAASIVTLLCFYSEAMSQPWQHVTSEFLAGDATTGSETVIVGRHGAIFLIADTLVEGARHFQVDLPDAGTYRNLHSVLAVDAEIILAGGDEGWILRSMDGGRKWTNERVDSESTIVGILLRGSEIVAYTQSEIFISTDSGRTWVLDESLERGVQQLAYSSESIGFLLDTTGSLFRTVDGWETWEPVLVSAVRRLRAFAINPGSGVGVVVGDSSTVFVSVDSGLTWQQKAFSSGNIYLKCILIRGDGAVFVGGEVPDDNFNAPAVYQSIDTGESWQGIRMGSTHLSFRVNALVERGGGGLLVLGNQGRVYEIDFDGVAVDTITATHHWYDMVGPSMSNAEPGFGSEGLVLYGSQVQGGGFCHRSTDGGITWQQILIRPDPIVGFELFENGEVLALSDDLRKTMHSTNGGQNWSLYRTTGEPTLSGTQGRGLFEFPTYDSGIALLSTGVNKNQQGHFYTSHDHGKTFTGGPVEDAITWTNLDFPLPHVGLAAGLESPDNFDSSEAARYHGIILRTTDRGQSWTPVFRRGGDFGYPSGLAMLSESEYLAGVDGGSVGVNAPYALIRTTDGGSTWIPVAEAPSIITDIVPFSDSTIVAVGWLGLILQSNDRGATWERYEFDVPPLDTIRQGAFVQAVLPNFENVALLPDRQTALIFGNSAVLRAYFDTPFPPVSRIVLNVEEEVPQEPHSLYAYPNPAADILHVDLRRSDVQHAALVTLHDALGRQAGTWFVRQVGDGIDVASLSVGAYLLQIHDEEGRVLAKQIVFLIR